jgi:hypothetical protein
VNTVNPVSGSFGWFFVDGAIRKIWLHLRFRVRLVGFQPGMGSGAGFCRFPVLGSTEAERLSGESRSLPGGRSSKRYYSLSLHGSLLSGVPGFSGDSAKPDGNHSANPSPADWMLLKMSAFPFISTVHCVISHCPGQLSSFHTKWPPFSRCPNSLPKNSTSWASLPSICTNRFFSASTNIVPSIP